LTTFVGIARGIGADVILGVYPSFAYAAQGTGAYESYLYHRAIYEVADELDCAVWDLQRRWGYGIASVDYSKVKWPLFDGVHPTLAGYEDMAIAEANLLQFIA
jgi:lysophospholipase L1-like esterase